MTFQKYLLKPMKSNDCASRSGLELTNISIFVRFFNTFWSPVLRRDSVFLFYRIVPNHDVSEISAKTNEIERLCLSGWPGIDGNLNIRQVFQYFLISSSASRGGKRWGVTFGESWAEEVLENYCPGSPGGWRSQSAWGWRFRNIY